MIFVSISAGYSDEIRERYISRKAMKNAEKFPAKQETEYTPAICPPEHKLSALEIKELKRTLAALIIGG
jgi:DNA mismatch repair ATPase MutS